MKKQGIITEEPIREFVTLYAYRNMRIYERSNGFIKFHGDCSIIFFENEDEDGLDRMPMWDITKEVYGKDAEAKRESLRARDS